MNVQKEFSEQLGLYTYAAVTWSELNLQTDKSLNCAAIFKAFFGFSFPQRKGYKCSYKAQVKDGVPRKLLFLKSYEKKKSISKLNIHNTYLMSEDKE